MLDRTPKPKKTPGEVANNILILILIVFGLGIAAGSFYVGFKLMMLLGSNFGV